MSSGNLFQPFPFRLFESNQYKILPNHQWAFYQHPVATVAPTKLEDFKCHIDPPGISGSLVEGRICYDAFVLENKAKAIYYQTVPAAVAAVSVTEE